MVSVPLDMKVISPAAPHVTNLLKTLCDAYFSALHGHLQQAELLGQLCRLLLSPGKAPQQLLAT